MIFSIRALATAILVVLTRVLLMVQLVLIALLLTISCPPADALLHKIMHINLVTSESRILPAFPFLTIMTVKVVACGVFIYGCLELVAGVSGRVTLTVVT